MSANPHLYSTMATSQRTDLEWVERLRAGARRPLSESERARRQTATRRALAHRDSLPSIAPDTTGDYIHEIRHEADARP